MIWSTCWISGKIPLHSGVPMISSTAQRLPRMTCGLFDSGFAGDVQFITSSGSVNALPTVVAVHEYDYDNDALLMNTQQQQHPQLLQAQDFYPSGDDVSDMKITTAPHSQGEKQEQQQSVIFNNQEKEAEDSWFNDLDPELSGDPLGDDSMEAFINLDKFLSGNSFFDEDGNLTVPDEPENMTNEEAEVVPVIDFTTHSEGLKNTTAVNNFDFGHKDLINDNGQDFLLPDEEIVKPITVERKKKSPRKRTATGAITDGGVKTSLYEIPAVSVIPEIIQDRSSSTDTELDHDYSTKRQRMSVPVMGYDNDNININDNAPSTSGAKRKIATLAGKQATIPKTVVCSDNDVVQILDESLDKQTIRRIKNNYASKRSREQRKQKISDMDREADELVVRNEELRNKIIELERLAKEMKAALVAKMVRK